MNYSIPKYLMKEFEELAKINQGKTCQATLGIVLGIVANNHIYAKEFVIPCQKDSNLQDSSKYDFRSPLIYTGVYKKKCNR